MFVPQGTDGWSFIVGLSWGLLIALLTMLSIGLYFEAHEDQSGRRQESGEQWSSRWSENISADIRQQREDDQWCRKADDDTWFRNKPHW